jgi:hypothetical protein
VPRHHIAAALLLAFSVAGARPADACKCAQPDLAKEVQGATAVFVGKPISATKRPIDPAECAKPAPNLCRYEYTHEVQVEGVWKGDVPATVTIDTGSGGGDCTFGDLGQEKWLFVTGPDLAIHRCGASQLATKEVLHQMKKQFGAPKAPKAAKPGKPDKPAKPDAPKAPAPPKAGKP